MIQYLNFNYFRLHSIHRYTFEDTPRDVTPEAVGHQTLTFARE